MDLRSRLEALSCFTGKPPAFQGFHLNSHTVFRMGDAASAAGSEGTPKREVRRSGWQRRLFVQHCSNHSIERRHFVLYDVPHDLRIQTEVLMNQNIAKTSHFLPLQRGMSGTKILRDFF